MDNLRRRHAGCPDFAGVAKAPLRQSPGATFALIAAQAGACTHGLPGVVAGEFITQGKQPTFAKRLATLNLELVERWAIPNAPNETENRWAQRVVGSPGAFRALATRWRQFQGRSLRLNDRAWLPFWAALEAVTPWGPLARTHATGIWARWEAAQARGEQLFQFEAELWPRKSQVYRAADARWVTRLVENLGGRCVQALWRPELNYYALRLEVPAGALRRVRESPNGLLACGALKRLRPLDRFLAAVPAVPPTEELPKEMADLSPEIPPVVALLGGLPAGAHPQLRGRVVSNPTNAPACPVSTQIAGAWAQAAGHARLAVAPVLHPLPTDWASAQLEARTPKDCLPLEAIENHLDRLRATQPQVHTVLVGFSDPHAEYTAEPDIIARFLDHYAAQHELLFVVPGGDNAEAIDLGLPRAALPLLQQQPERLAALLEEQRQTHAGGILAPADTANGVAVGALHSGGTPLPSLDERLRVLTPPNAPQPTARQGPGHTPACWAPGGQLAFVDAFYREGDSTLLRPTLEVNGRTTGPGFRVPTLTRSGEPAMTYASGSLFAAAQLAGKVAQQAASGLAAKCLALHLHPALPEPTTQNVWFETLTLEPGADFSWVELTLAHSAEKTAFGLVLAWFAGGPACALRPLVRLPDTWKVSRKRVQEAPSWRRIQGSLLPPPEPEAWRIGLKIPGTAQQPLAIGLSVTASVLAVDPAKTRAVYEPV